MYASHNFQQELSTYNYGHTFRKLAVSKHVRINGNETSDWDFVYNLLKYLKKQLKLLLTTNCWFVLTDWRRRPSNP